MADLGPPQATGEVTLAQWKRDLREELDRDKREQELRDDIAKARAHLATIATVAGEVGDALHFARRWAIPILISIASGRAGLDMLVDRSAEASQMTAQEAHHDDRTEPR